MQQTKKKICFIAILGRPNVGKSSLMNQIVNYNVSIVTNTPQTTRDQIAAIYNDEEYQLIFIDTPGIHKPLNKLGEALNKNALQTISETDLVLFLTPADEKLGKGDLYILEQIQKIENKIAVISKIDKINDINLITQKIEDLSHYNFKMITSVSVNKHKSVEDLINILKENAYEDLAYYDDDYITDKSMRFLAKEIIRESAINSLYEELPHSIAVEVSDFEEESEDQINIRAVIYVKKDSQKGMVIGVNGQKIKQIGKLARLKMQQQFDTHVYLELKVKVAKKWVDDEKQLKRFGY
ncbi:GTPase Era [Mycoplasmopsis ciconiae]|uniref:GTPase Era n=1 Tax=Mycoplasmopsis ciconiae TaxID=561067 RepID=A0ABU7MLY9_9BACT|nr:GTPase Era [Mycoplasmopsis ciconiae]